MTHPLYEQPGREAVSASLPETGRPAIGAGEFQLRAFFPYLVRIFYRAVSGSVSQVYASKYGLTPNEWRTMAVIGLNRSLSASEIVEQSSMDKINVSRAVKRLHEAGLVKRNIDGDDRRRSALHLTEKGAAMYRDLVPLVLGVEERLLSGFSAEQRKTLVDLMARVRENADKIQGEHSAPSAPGAHRMSSARQ